MSYDQWKCRDPNDTGFYDMPEDDGPTELDIAYQRIEALVKALILAEDVLSRRPFSTEIWPNGMHPQCGIEQIRNAIAGVVGKVQVP